MPNGRESSHGVMEGGGSYNRHARVPAGGGSLALPFLEQAVQNPHSGCQTYALVVRHLQARGRADSAL
jgi:hypothetical protein